jgi:hypothetical protein
MTITEVIEKYNSICDQALILNIFVRDTSLQKNMIKELTQFKQIIKYCKNQDYMSSDIPDKQINMWFHFQCVLNCLINCLNMWVYLKKYKYYEAWDSLVDAQTYIHYAIKSQDSENCFGVEELQSRLNNFENILFPDLQFLSSGLIITGGVCTICNNALENCDHIEQEIYRGKVCFRANHKIVRADHVAFVDHPEDKGCFITQIEDKNGNTIDSLTRKIIKKNTNKNPGKSMICKKAIVIRSIGLELI